MVDAAPLKGMGFLKLDEAGTEAAAATLVVEREICACGCYADRPFLDAIGARRGGVRQVRVRG